MNAQILKTKRPPLFSRPSPGVIRAIRWAVLFGACIFVINAVVGDAGLVDSVKARRQYQRLVFDVERLKIHNETLRVQARRFRSDPRAVEEVARGELGLIAPGELVFIFNDTPRRPR